MKEFFLEIVTPEGTVFSGNAESLLVRTSEGDVEIMAGHTDYFAAIGIGIAKLKTAEATRPASCAGGLLSVVGGQVSLAATTFEFAESIDIQRAKAAKETAEQKISSAKDERTIRLAKAKLARALNRINASELIR